MADQSFSTGVEIEELEFSGMITADNSEPKVSYAEEPKVNDVSMPASRLDDHFDYSGVSKTVADEAEKTAQRIRDRLRGSIIETGNDLLDVKEKLGHGKFGGWLKFHFSMSERSAQNFMNAAVVFGSAPGVIDALPPTTVYKLAAKSAPIDVRQSVIDEIAAGVVISHMEVETRLTAARDQERKKRDNERFKKQEASDWQKREQELRKAETSDEEISVARKRWDAKKAQKERQKEKKLAKAVARVARARLDVEARDQEEKKMEANASEAVKILKKRLGESFAKFSTAILRIDFNQFQEALRNA